MLGSMLLDNLARESRFRLVATVRSESDIVLLQPNYPTVMMRLLNAETCSEFELAEIICDASWVINAIGLIKQRIIGGDDAHVERAVRINTLFSFMLARVAGTARARVIQIATDCVYSGLSGGYDETAPHDCLDIYGRTKSLGEVRSSVVYNLRCSIIGFERRSSVSLLNWFLSHDRYTVVNGFVDHLWNGITTLHFAKICRGIMLNDMHLPNCQHVVPKGVVSKDELLRLCAEAFGREDIHINSVCSPAGVDRTLLTRTPNINRMIWEAADYPGQPSIREMIFELARHWKATSADERV